MKKNLQDIAPAPEAESTTLRSPSPFHDAPPELRCWPKSLEDGVPGKTYEKTLDEESQSWTQRNYDYVTEAARASWEVIDDKATVAMTCSAHESILDCIVKAKGSNPDSEAAAGLYIETITTIPLVRGWKEPDILIMDEGTNWPDKDNVPAFYGWPIVVFDVGYPETRRKIQRSIFRLLLWTEGLISISVGFKLCYNDEKFIDAEVLLYYLSDKGTLSSDEARLFIPYENYVFHEGEWYPVEEKQEGDEVFRMVCAFTSVP